MAKTGVLPTILSEIAFEPTMREPKWLRNVASFNGSSFAIILGQNESYKSSGVVETYQDLQTSH